MRAALTDGAILSWDTGLGKSLAAFSLPLIKLGWQPGARGRLTLQGTALLVAPGGLHDQLRDTGRQFGQELTTLDKARFRRLARYDARQRRWALPPGFYLTSYTQLGRNGAEAMPDWAAMAPRDRWASLGVTPALADQHRLAHRTMDEAPLAPWSRLSGAEQVEWMERAATCLAGAHALGVAQTPDVRDPHHLRCVWDTTLSDEAGGSFDCVVVDEGTRLKGESFIAAGVLRLRPRYRYVLSATPVKNRLPDFFALAWWAAGGEAEATPRFPYRPADRDDFAARFCQTATKLDPATGRRAKGGWRRLTPHVCEVHALWKLNAALVIRRRKQDSGVDIPPKHRHVIRVRMNPIEAQAYRALLDADTDPGTKLARLREFSGTVHAKQCVALSLLERSLRQGEQMIFFSAFHAPIRALRGHLQAAGVPHLFLTHEVGEQQRGRLARQFAAGPVPGGLPVMLAGTACMSEGFNFPRCTHVVHLDFSLSADHMVQADNRIHRLNSVGPVHSWRILVDGTVDRALEALDGEKQDAAELVLDGHLLNAPVEDVTPSRILAQAGAEWEAHATPEQSRTTGATLAQLIASVARQAPRWPTAPPASTPGAIPRAARPVLSESEALAELLGCP